MIKHLLSIIGTIFRGIDTRHLICFSQIIVAIIKERTVNLSKLSLHCHYGSKRLEARYRRLQRFINKLPIKQEQLATFIMSFFKERILMALDRTNWAFGCFEINIMVISLVYKNYSFPLFWILLPHKGCSGQQDRISLLNKFIDVFGAERIEALLMDREFIGSDWLKFLNWHNITFHLRVKNNTKIERLSYEQFAPKYYYNLLRKLEKIDFPFLRTIGSKKHGIKLFVSIVRSSDNKLVIICSNKSPDIALDRYKLRWAIESLFSCFKIRGFHLEDTHLHDHHKVSNLFLLLSFTFFWAFKIGEWLNDSIPIKLKSHNRKSIAFFRYGLNALIMLPNSIHLLLPLLSLTPQPPPLKLLTAIGLA